MVTLMNLHLTLEGSLGRMVLSRPPHNTLPDPALLDEQALENFFAQPQLTGVLVMGEGRHFSGGADRSVLAQQLDNPEELSRRLAQGKRWLSTLAFAPVPTVAAISGQCLGAGCEIALACHFRVAAPGAMLGFPESTLGLMPGLGGTQPGAARLSRPTLIDLILSGRLVGSDEALSLGLIDRIDPHPAAGAEQLLKQLVGDRQPILIRAVMEAIHNGARLTREAALRRETELFCEVAQSLIASGDHPA